jgi:hypothetical protein
MIIAFGTKASKRKARDHRKACFAAIAEMNKVAGFSDMSDDELFAELGI